MPAQYFRPLSDPGIPVFIENEQVYRSMEIYPAIATGNLSTQYMNGYGFAQSVFTPAMYIPGNGTITYYGKVTIRIETRETSRGLQALNNLTSSDRVKISCSKNARIRIYCRLIPTGGQPQPITRY